VKIARFSVFCFNVTPEFATGYKFPKSNGKGDFSIKYMEAVFNKEAGSGEFFLDFEEFVWEHKLVESFQSHGAGQVTVVTFAHNDGGESASNALLRIMTLQEKHTPFSRGTCPPALLAKVQAKRAEASRQQQASSQEFDEKTAAAIKQSLEAQELQLEKINTGVQSQAGELVDIKHGVCNVIPDYQNEIKTLKDALVHKTAVCDTVEGKLGHKTRLINQQDAYIAKLEEDAKVFISEKQAWMREKSELVNKNSILEDELEKSRNFKSILEKACHFVDIASQTAEILSSTLAEERAAKRARPA